MFRLSSVWSSLFRMIDSRSLDRTKEMVIPLQLSTRRGSLPLDL